MTSTSNQTRARSAENGAGPAAPGGQPRRPFADAARSRAGLRTQPRSRGLIAAAAVLVLLFGAATAYLMTTAGDKVSVLTIGRPIAEGQTIEREALVSTAVSGVPGAIPVSAVVEVVGQTAAVDLVEGQVLTAAMLTSEPTPASGQAMVGLALPPATAPTAGLEPGDVVRVLAVTGPESSGSGTDQTAGTTLSASATVHQVSADAASSGVLMTVVLPEAEAAAVAAASAAGEVAVIEISASSARGP